MEIRKYHLPTPKRTYGLTGVSDKDTCVIVFHAPLWFKQAPLFIDPETSNPLENNFVGKKEWTWSDFFTQRFTILCRIDLNSTLCINLNVTNELIFILSSVTQFLHFMHTLCIRNGMHTNITQPVAGPGGLAGHKAQPHMPPVLSLTTFVLVFVSDKTAW